MARVYSYQAFVACEIKEEATWGVDPGTWDTAAYRVPFVGEDLHYDQELIPDSQEFTGLGGVQEIDYGTRVVTGSITVEPDYNSIWFWKLFAHAWGAEDIKTGEDVLEAVEADMNTHGFTPGSGLATGLSMRLWKSGAADTGSLDTITGLIVTRMVWNQPRGDRAQVTFDYIGKAITTSAANGLTPLALETGRYKVKSTDLQRAGSITKSGLLAATDINCNGLTITIDRKIEVADGFLQSLLTVDKPDIVGTREVTLEIDADLEVDYNATGKPWQAFKAEADGTLVLIYDSGQIAVGAKNYKIRWDLPAVKWTDVRANIDRPGPGSFRATGRGKIGAITLLGTIYDTHQDIPSGGSTDIRCLVQVSQADEPSVDAKFSQLDNS